jgi:hypothetical protein
MDTIIEDYKYVSKEVVTKVQSTVHIGSSILTDVVRTPQSSNFSNWGVGALGVSINSNSLSEPFVL